VSSNAVPVLSYATPQAAPGRTVTAATCANAAEAELVANELAAAGIPAQVIDQHTEMLGPYVGGASVKVVVLEADAARAAEVLRHSTSDELEPAEEPADAPPLLDEDGGPLRPEEAARFDSPRLLRDAATTLAAARIRAFLPTLVPRGDRPPGVGKRFILRVREEDLDRARKVLAEAEEEAADEGEPRCPKCRSWRVYKIGAGFWKGLRAVFGLGCKQDRVEGFECLACGHRGPSAEFARHGHE
jgi:hypothetical protein